MPPDQPHDLTDPRSLIPDPVTVRRLLYHRRMEARLLARLLRLAEDRVKVLPHDTVTGESPCPR